MNERELIGKAYQVRGTRDTLQEVFRHVELGIDHLIVDSPVKFNEDPGFKILREQMERVAQVCGLQTRPRNNF